LISATVSGVALVPHTIVEKPTKVEVTIPTTRIIAHILEFIKPIYFPPFKFSVKRPILAALPSFLIKK
jgi:hypothetical protein